MQVYTFVYFYLSIILPFPCSQSSLLILPRHVYWLCSIFCRAGVDVSILLFYRLLFFAAAAAAAAAATIAAAAAATTAATAAATTAAARLNRSAVQ